MSDWHAVTAQTPQEKVNELSAEVIRQLRRLQVTITHHIEGVKSSAELSIEMGSTLLLMAVLAHSEEQLQAWRETGEHHEQ